MCAKKGDKNNKQTLLYKIIYRVVRLFYRQPKLIGTENLPSGGAIIVGNHAQANGPMFSVLRFPTPKAVWCRGEMMSVKETPSYAYNDFWANKPKGIRWFYKIASYAIAPLTAYTFKRADTLAVYKDSRLLSTFKNSVSALENGKNLVIFPEEPQTYNNVVNEFQDKFIDVAKLYYSRSKKAVSFVPMYVAPALKTVVFGKPIRYDPSLPIAEQRKEICDYLKSEITSLAQSLPRHKVKPYLNLPKKLYPYSK